MLKKKNSNMKSILTHTSKTILKQSQAFFSNNPTMSTNKVDLQSHLNDEAVKFKSQNKRNKYDYKKLLFGINARNTLSEGIKKVTDSVEMTFGPLGRNFAISNHKEEPIITKDGVTVAHYISDNDRKIQLGINLVNNISGNTNKFAGDGTTTSTVLAGQLVKRGHHLINSGYDPVSITEGILFSKQIFNTILEKIKFPVVNEKLIYDLAMISTANDKDLSEVVAKSLIMSGVDGEMLIEDSYYENTMVVQTRAFSLIHGAASTSFLESVGEVSFKNSFVLVLDFEFNDQLLVDNLIRFGASIAKNFIIFSPKTSSSVISQLLQYNKSSDYKGYAVNIPDYVNDNFNQLKLKDIAIITGAKLLSKEDIEDCHDLYSTFNNNTNNTNKSSSHNKNHENKNSSVSEIEDIINTIIPEEYLGLVETITITDLETILISPKGDQDIVDEHVNEITEYIRLNEKTLTQEELENNTKRINNLNQKTSLILIGGGTEVEKNNNRDKIVDSLNTCKNAIENGVIIGGGNAYLLVNQIFLLLIEFLKSNSNRILRIINNANTKDSSEDAISKFLFSIDLKHLSVDLLNKEDFSDKENRSTLINKIKDNINIEMSEIYKTIESFCLINRYSENYSESNKGDYGVLFREQRQYCYSLGQRLFFESLLDLVKILYLKNHGFSGDRVIEEYQENFINIRNKEMIREVREGEESKDNEYNILKYGFSLKRNCFSNDLVSEGLVDSYSTITTAIEDATKLATLFLNTECLIVNEYNYQPSQLETFQHKFSDDYDFRMQMKQNYQEMKFQLSEKDDNPQVDLGKLI